MKALNGRIVPFGAVEPHRPLAGRQQQHQPGSPLNVDPNISNATDEFLEARRLVRDSLNVDPNISNATDCPESPRGKNQ